MNNLLSTLHKFVISCMFQKVVESQQMTSCNKPDLLQLNAIEEFVATC